MSRTSVQWFSNDSNENPNVKKDYGKFTFANGDTYVGGYMILKDKQFLSRQGEGIYVTEDFNKYETHWVEDLILKEVNVCHNNGTQYKGTLGTDGSMFGFGTYTFRDNSVLEGIWERNKPMEDIILKEPSGSIWKGVCNGEEEIAFTDGNHFWDEMKPSVDHSEEEQEEGEEKDHEKYSDINPNDSESIDSIN